MNKQAIYRKQLLAKIHTHKEYKTLKKYDEWENFLFNHFKVSTCAVLSINELKSVLDLLNKKIQDLKSFDYFGRMLVARLNNKILTSKQLATIKALQAALKWDNKKLKRFTQRFLKKENFYTLKKEEANKLIFVLQKIYLGKNDGQKRTFS